MTGDSTQRPGSRAVWFAGAVLALALAGGAYTYVGVSHSAQAQTAATPPPPVTVAKPLRRELIEWDEFTGQFSAVDFVEIRARVSGYLESVHFQDGQLVRKGDLLFVIDPRPFEAAVASAKAQLAQANARLDLANQQLARAASLRQRDVLSGSVYDERIQEARVATAGIEVAKAALRTAELDLEFTRITAPSAGRISKREVSVGNLIAGGSGGAPTLLTTIVSLDPIYFDFDMSESDFLAYQRATARGLLAQQRDGGVQVQARLFDERDWPLNGRIDFIDNQVDRGAGTIRARAVFDNPDLMLTPGQFGRLRLPGSELYTATLLPDSAIVSDQSNKIVLTVAEDGTVVPKPVRPGPIEDGLRIIRSGLDPEDRVIISGIVRARPGSKVTPQPGEIQAAEVQAPEAKP
ncbi:efflux RND transporter periplasmic adaptor subunit [Skermanella pratensis]|uniref:efflux RND transporter periplasmic adaptor subunit n=1 Tax=Skermanella pratensis TaxID=2233999 RepID=UPI001300CB9D|nr:efflux RND transporter periplasmic adaptor subunit [Skermanella pratensis]